MPVKNDQEIIKLLAKGNKKEYAFNLIMEQYKEKLYNHIRRILLIHEDADDVLQNTFVKVWFAIDRFRGDSSLYTWLYRIATNEAITFLKKKKKHRLFPISGKEKELLENLESDPYFNGDKIQLRLQNAILKLPDKQRIVFNMKYYQDMKYEDMAQILGTSTGALKASYHHAVKKITGILNSI